MTPFQWCHHYYITKNFPIWAPPNQNFWLRQCAWVNNLMVFKKIGFCLEKIGGLSLVASLLCSIASVCIVGSFKKAHFQLYKAFVWPVLSYSSPGWYPFFCDTLERLGNESQKCLQSNLWLLCFHSWSIVAFEIAHLPLLQITLNHRTLFFYEWALRFPADNFSLQRVASSPVLPTLKRLSWRSFCSKPQAPRVNLILCLSTPPQISLWPLSLKAAPAPTRCCSRLS